MPTMQNVKMNLDENMLTIIVDLSQDFGKSTTGKTRIIATTRGPKRVEGRDERVTLTVYRKS